MKTITHNTADITIQGDGMSTIDNRLTYSVTTVLNDLPTAISIFGNVFIYKDNKFIANGIVAIDDLHDTMTASVVEQSDVALSGKSLISNFSTSIIWGKNALSLDTDTWTFNA